jgi:hypothetical protein
LDPQDYKEAQELQELQEPQELLEPLAAQDHKAAQALLVPLVLEQVALQELLEPLAAQDHKAAQDQQGPLVLEQVAPLAAQVQLGPGAYRDSRAFLATQEPQGHRARLEPTAR